MKTFILTIFFCLCTCFVQAQAWQQLYQKADSLRQKRDFETAFPLFEQALPLAEKEYGKASENYLKTCDGLGTCMSDKVQAEVHLNESLELSAKLNKKSTIHIALLTSLAACHATRGNYSKAEPLYRECVGLSQEVLGTKHTTYAFSLLYLGAINKEMGRYTEAESLYKQSVEVFVELLGKKHTNYALVLNTLADLYLEIGQYALAEPLYKEVLQICKEVLGEKHHLYAASLNNLAVLQKEKGNYAIAEPLYKTSLDIKKATLGAKDLDYATSLGNLGTLYTDMGIYDAAEQMTSQAVQIIKEGLGSNHPYYARWVENLAAIQRLKGDYKTAESMYREAIVILKNILGISHTGYATCLGNLAELYCSAGQYALAESMYQEVLDTQTKSLGKEHPHTINSLQIIADLYCDMGNHALSVPMQLEILEQRRTIQSENRQDFIGSMVNLSSQYQILKQYDKALPLIKKACSLSKDMIAKNFSFLSEKEKADYYKSQIEEGFNKFNAFAITQTDLNAELYDQQLFSKGILLNTSQKMKSRILNSKDSSLIATYNQWTNLRFALAKYAQMEKAMLEATKVNLDSLENLANSLEKELARQSEAFASITDNKVPTWQDVQKLLKKNQAAIELVRINKFGIAKTVIDTSAQKVNGKFPEYKVHGLTDTIYYAALIITAKSKTPELVLLKNGNDLEMLYATYQKNAIAFQEEDTSSYQQFWQPI
ncbi:MAG: tetratricopeptide repeat protein, partial [Cytophagales bacterium]